jgi:hypothetical protein
MTKAEQTAQRDDLPHEVLPIPDRPRVGLTTFAATDPGATVPPIERLRPRTGSQCQPENLATKQPEELHELQRLFILEASKYNVFPVDDRLAKGFNLAFHLAQH